MTEKGPVEVPSNEFQAYCAIFEGIPGIYINIFEAEDAYLVQRNGKQGTFTSALEAINFYNSTFNDN